MAKEKKQDSGWQFPKALEIVKCKEGNKALKGVSGTGRGFLCLMHGSKRLCGWRCERGIYMHTSGKGKEKRL